MVDSEKASAVSPEEKFFCSNRQYQCNFEGKSAEDVKEHLKGDCQKEQLRLFIVEKEESLDLLKTEVRLRDEELINLKMALMMGSMKDDNDLFAPEEEVVHEQPILETPSSRASATFATFGNFFKKAFKKEDEEAEMAPIAIDVVPEDDEEVSKSTTPITTTTTAADPSNIRTRAERQSTEFDSDSDENPFVNHQAEQRFNNSLTKALDVVSQNSESSPGLLPTISEQGKNVFTSPIHSMNNENDVVGICFPAEDTTSLNNSQNISKTNSFTMTGDDRNTNNLMDGDSDDDGEFMNSSTSGAYEQHNAHLELNPLLISPSTSPRRSSSPVTERATRNSPTSSRPVSIGGAGSFSPTQAVFDSDRIDIVTASSPPFSPNPSPAPVKRASTVTTISNDLDYEAIIL